MTKKVLHRQRVGYDRSYYDLDGKIEDVIKRLTTLLLEAEKDGYTNIIIDWSDGYSSDDIQWCIYGDRPETDAEYEARLKIEKRLTEQRKKDKITKEQQERKEYERLKKKFENKDKVNG